MRELLRRGYTDFIDQMASYFATRSPEYWAEVHRRTQERYAQKLDPELGKLRAAGDAESGAVKAAFGVEVAKRDRLLGALWTLDTIEEDAWGETSTTRVVAEIDQADKRADAEYDAGLKRALVMATVGVATIGAQARTGNVSPDVLASVPAKTDEAMAKVERVERVWAFAKSRLGLEAAKPDDPLALLIAQLERVHGDGAALRKAARAEYARIVGPAADAIARARAAPGVTPKEPAGPPVRTKPKK